MFPIPHPRVQHKIQEIGGEIDADVDDRHPDDVGLDQRIIAHHDRVHRQFPHAVPKENRLDDGGAAQERADGEREQRHDGHQRRPQHVFREDHAVRHAPRLRARHIVLGQLVQHRRPHLPEILRRHGDAERQRRQDGPRERRAARNDGQPAEADGEKVHQEQRHEKIRHGVADEADEAHDGIQQEAGGTRGSVSRRLRLSMGDGGDYAQRDGDRDGQKDARRRKEKRGGQLRQERVEHVLPGYEALSHVAGQHIGEPRKILDEKRPVESEPRPRRVQSLLRYGGAHARIHLRDRVAPRQPHQGEGKERDSQKHGNKRQKPLQDIALHSPQTFPTIIP